MKNHAGIISHFIMEAAVLQLLLFCGNVLDFFLFFYSATTPGQKKKKMLVKRVDGEKNKN